MSTKPASSFTALNGTVLPDAPVCSIREFCPATDMPVLYKWMSHEYAGPLLYKAAPPAELVESYACMIESDFAQPYMGLVNDVPVCQIDIYRTQQDALSLYYDAQPGDHGIQLLTAPLAIQHNMIQLMRTCLTYFFSFAEIGRIVVEVSRDDDWTQTLFEMAGFRIAGKIRMPYKVSNLFICTREGLFDHPLDAAASF